MDTWICERCGHQENGAATEVDPTRICPQCQTAMTVASGSEMSRQPDRLEGVSNEPPPPNVVMAPPDWPEATPTQTTSSALPEWVQSQWNASPASPRASNRDTVPTTASADARWSGLALSIVVPYAICVTLIAGWLYYQKRQKAGTDHPLANIPDILGEYEPARRIIVGRRLDRLPDVDNPLPPELLVRLGETREIGDLQVTPEKVERRRIDIHTVFTNGETQINRPKAEALVLHLRLKNCSPDVWFHPTDPAFVRKYQPRRSAPRPYTQIIADGYRSYGGPIEWSPPRERSHIRRMFVAGQEHDDQPLAPGEERRTIICSDPADEQLWRSVQRHDRPEPIVWRVQLRRGLVHFQDRDWSVCAVVGVQFQPNDVRR